MKKLGFAGAALAALLAASCGPGYNDDDVDDVEELPNTDDLGEPENNDLDDVRADLGGSFGAGSNATMTKASAAPADSAADMDTLTIKVMDSGQYGAYLARGDGRPLYLFTADTRAVRGTEPAIACTGECLDAWPPAETIERPFSGERVDRSLVATTDFQDRMIATYRGWPLYYFSRDEGGAAEPKGQGIESFGGSWSLITPDGLEIDESRG